METIPKIVFVGTRPLAASCLGYLADRVGTDAIKGVLTIPRGTYGWWKNEGKPEVWEVAEAKALPLIDETDLTKLDYDLLFCVYWGTIFKDDVLNRPSMGCFNLHTAPLPDYRGCFSYSHAILNDDTHYGSTFHKMHRRTDHGDIIGWTRFPIETKDTARSLYDKTVQHSFPLFVDVLEKILDRTIKLISQDEISQQTGRMPRYYNNKSLEPFYLKPEVILNIEGLLRLQRALTFPPRFAPPDWLKPMIETQTASDSNK